MNKTIIQMNPTTVFELKSLDELHILKEIYEVNNLRINVSRLARELDCDRRTIKKYLNGYNKPKTKSKPSIIDEYHPIITQLLSKDSTQIFEYKRVLWQYLVDQHGLECSQSSFRRYISKYPEFNQYFINHKLRIKTSSAIRYETAPGEQAQLDWKESMEFILITGEVVQINIFALLLSYSRIRIYRLSLSRSQEVLFHFLTESFEVLGGVPKVILTDNMKTVMDEPRTKYVKGKVNQKFDAYANDFNFKVSPCIARNPWAKGKVESIMKLLDEVKAYSGTLDYDGLHQLIIRLNNRQNNEINQATNCIPTMLFGKEKAHLQQLPRAAIRGHYKLVETTVYVNKNALVSFKSNLYSVPPKYIGNQVKIQVHGKLIHVYYNTSLISVHEIQTKKLNYIEDHYHEIIQHSFEGSYDSMKLAKENLKKIGEMYQNDEQL